MKTPIALYLDPVGACNMKCPTCPRGRDEIDVRKGITWELYTKILDKAESENWVHTLCLYNWGEPLLHPELDRLILEGQRRGMWVQISTTLNRDLDILRGALPDSIIVSMSGWTQETYQQGHRGGNINKVKLRLVELDAMRRWAGRKMEIILTWHRYKHNLEEEHLAAEYAARHGFKWRPVDAIQMSLPDILQAINDKKDAYPNLLRHPKDALVPASESSYCPRQQHQLFIDCEGIVQLCCSTHQTTLGPYLETSWSEILAKKMVHPICRICKSSGAEGYMCAAPSWKEKVAQRVIKYRAFWWLKNLVR